MIGYHCGQRVVPKSYNPVYFKVQCAVCKAVFKQRKRQPLKKEVK